jgi:hypothetical protein
MSNKISHTVPLARVNEAAEHGAKPVCLGKAPKPKGYPIFVHSATPGRGGAYDSNPGNPLNAGPPIGKRLTPPMPSPGMRSRTNEDTLKASLADMGKLILDEAGDNSALDDRRALGIGTLPTAVTEE